MSNWLSLCTGCCITNAVFLQAEVVVLYILPGSMTCSDDCSSGCWQVFWSVMQAREGLGGAESPPPPPPPHPDDEPSSSPHVAERRMGAAASNAGARMRSANAQGGSNRRRASSDRLVTGDYEDRAAMDSTCLGRRCCIAPDASLHGR